MLSLAMAMANEVNGNKKLTRNCEDVSSILIWPLRYGDLWKGILRQFSLLDCWLVA